LPENVEVKDMAVLFGAKDYQGPSEELVAKIRRVLRIEFNLTE
jgi:hypothetical protein